jgi:iron complex transport system substrate-binding protein
VHRISRRSLLAAPAAFIAVTALRPTAWADDATPAASPVGGTAADGTWFFTDATGRTVSLPEKPTRVIAQTTSAAALWDLGFEVVGIYGPGPLPGGGVDSQAGNVDLGKVEYLGDYGALDLEKVVILDPQLYVDVDRGNGAAWYGAGDAQDQFDALVPTVLIRAGGNSVIDTIGQFETLAAALGADLKADAVVASRTGWQDVEAKFTAAVAAKPGLQVLAVAPDPQQVYIVNPNWVGDLIYVQDLGLTMIAPEKPDPTTFNNFEIDSWENIGQYTDQADVILVDIRNAPDWATGIDFWQTLPAVKAGQVGVWNGVFPFTYTGLTYMLGPLTATIEAAKVL